MCIRDRRYPVAHSFTIKELKAPFGYNKAEDRIVTMPYNQTVVNSETTAAVSYTHLDVYKRQEQYNEPCAVYFFTGTFIR